jgi:tetratricopeptide (TPR) repeat protein
MNIIRNLLCLFRDDEYEVGIKLYNTHKYREAIEKFESVITRKSSRFSLHHNLANFYCSYAHRNLGVLLFVMGDYPAAHQEFEKALICSTNPNEIYQLMGICQNNIGDYENAAHTFTLLSNNHPDNLPTKLRLSIALHNMKMWDKSVELYSTILAQKPRYADVHYRLGLALLGQNNPALAVASFSAAISINPDYVAAHIKLGLTQAYLGQFDVALASFTSILDRHPDFADIHYALGIVYAGLNRMQDSRTAFEQALKINPDYKDALIKISILCCHLGDNQTAADCLDRAARVDPDDRNLQLAITAVADIMGRSGEEAGARDELLLLFGGGKSIEQAIGEFNKHLKIKPDLSTVLAIIKEFSQEDSGLLEMLIPAVQDVAREHPDYPDTYNTLGSIYLKLCKHERAEDAFHEALRINPDYLKARVNLFAVQKLMGNTAGALEQGARIVDSQAEYPDVYCGMGEILQGLGRYDDALAHLDKATALRPSHSVAYFLKARILVQCERHTEAEQAYEACLASSPGTDMKRLSHDALQALRNVH